MSTVAEVPTTELVAQMKELLEKKTFMENQIKQLTLQLENVWAFLVPVMHVFVLFCLGKGRRSFRASGGQ